MKVLFLYNSTQTFTNTVYEHLASFGSYSVHHVFYAHADPASVLNLELANFDVVCIHFSIRLPFDQVSISVEKSLEAFSGLKVLFIQDEYDFPHRSWHWIRRLAIHLVFTVVPETGIETVYPRKGFPNTRFVTNLTGYVPEKLTIAQDLPPPSQRNLIVGYRGRQLPIRYGKLGVDKVRIGENVKAYCDNHGLVSDIAWGENDRIYGPKWYDFVVSCRSMLGSESGSNVFDWDGTLGKLIEQYRADHPKATDEEIYQHLIHPREIDGLMNQISPRVFEAISSRTILILLEGEYSGVIKPDEHFIALKKDYSNLKDVFVLLKNSAYVDEMADRAWHDIIASGKYSYKSFVGMVDMEIERSLKELGVRVNTVLKEFAQPLTPITTRPILASPPLPVTVSMSNIVTGSLGAKNLASKLAIYLWYKLPKRIRLVLKPRIKHLFGKG